MRIFRKQSLISILPLGILLTLFEPSLARADVLPRDESRVSYCFKITNIDKYPDYLFMVVEKSDGPRMTTRNRFLKSGKCHDLGGYRVYGEVYALKKSDVDLEQDIIGEFERLKDLESKKAKLIPATGRINPIRTMRNIYQIDKVAKGYEIADINNRYLSLRNSSITYIYKNNKSETKAYLDGDKLPLPSSKNTAFLWYIPIFGMSLIGGAAYWNKCKKPNKAE
ncbi:hypothetical protein Riv7116_3257 [Rivularia sp. PCC 7116]|uniref:hypothetical protein n=1 Tax=Rivularia sp. PCC 7116 TaxID=373994 RepID=UPI00029EF5EB|nr:hypothetical protein [Rivularia sp. PCC 7116]AFY55727.1 hypothetical protein Riv7116_3257 [Rivularia sp. PCC 7116]